MCKEMEIGFKMALQMLRIAGWEAACELLRQAGSRAEARGIFKALREQSNGRSIA